MTEHEELERARNTERDRLARMTMGTPASFEAARNIEALTLRLADLSEASEGKV